MGKYARGTVVSVSKSRQEIENILRRWGAHQLQWGDDFKLGRVALRFAWEHDGTTYVARFNIQLPTDEEIKEQSRHSGNTWGKFCQGKYDKLVSRRGMVEHRELAFFIKAAFVAVEAGIILAEHLFLPFIEDQHGVTVAEAILPNLPSLLQGMPANRLLEGEVS